MIDDQDIDDLKTEWGKAEEAIKAAENVCGQVVFPSILELRYAGRKLVQVMVYVRNNNKSDAEKVLRDAIFDCHRARHDAIDTATAHMLIHIEKAVEILGYDVVLRAYPDFAQLKSMLLNIQLKSTLSRKNLNDRDSIYETIVVEDFPDLCKRYGMFCTSEAMMRAFAKKNRWSKLIGYIGWTVTALIALGAWFFPIK